MTALEIIFLLISASLYGLGGLWHWSILNDCRRRVRLPVALLWPLAIAVFFVIAWQMGGRPTLKWIGLEHDPR